jgi:hypothetical protein
MTPLREGTGALECREASIKYWLSCFRYQLLVSATRLDDPETDHAGDRGSRGGGVSDNGAAPDDGADENSHSYISCTEDACIPPAVHNLSVRGADALTPANRTDFRASTRGCDNSDRNSESYSAAV